MRGLLFLVRVALVGSVAARASAAPDLVVRAVDASALGGDWQTLIVSGTVAAEIANQGSTDAATPFTVLFFADANGTRSYEPGTDTVLATTVVAGLLAAASTSVSATIAPVRVRFRDDLVFALVDSINAVAEADEANNGSDSGLGCRHLPPVGSFQPRLEWSWVASSVLPASLNVLATPVVIEVSGDGVPDVLVVTTASVGGGITEPGVLRALSGADGSELFTVTDPALTLNAAGSLAAGDIDGDGRPEIIACDVSGAQLIAFEHDGSFKWLSGVLEAVNWGSAAIADLDADGSPEIVVGRQVLDATGALRWTGSAGRGAQGQTGPLSLVADIDIDGSPEVVAGNTVYAADGALRWTAAAPDGFSAIGNFDADPYAEIVLVSASQVWLLEHDGSIRWGPVAIPGGGSGGPPIVADYDNDGAPEIGVAGAVRYVVLETDGSILWTAITQDASSNATGSSAFDFDGDGSAEVVYRDELFLRIYRGTDGAVQFQVPMSSCTWHDYVLVADVDADDNAEIVAVANTNCGIGPERGVFVFGDASNNWVRTRRIWNQHTYHITNVNDDGTIPVRESDNWRYPAGSPYNNFRQNLLTRELPAVPDPDLSASLLTCPAAGASSRQLTARIGNGGSATVPTGVPVSFYDGDPMAGGLLLGTTATATALAPGRSEDVAFAIPAAYRFADTLYVYADGPGATTAECREDNNIHSRLAAQAIAGPDARVCEGMLLQLDASASSVPDCPGGLSYVWRRGATVVQGASPGAIYAPPTTPPGVVTYEVDVTCSSPTSCPVTDSVTVTVVACPLTVSFGPVEARERGEVVEVEWTTRSEVGTLGFTVERALGADGVYRSAGEGVEARGPGFVYRVVLAASEADWYRVVEHTVNGRGDESPKVELARTGAGEAPASRKRSRKTPRSQAR